MDIISIVGLLVGTITSIIGSLVAQRFARIQRKSVAEAEDYFRKAQQEVRNKLVHDLAMSIDDKQMRDLLLKEFIVHLESSTGSEINAAQQAKIKKEIEDRTALLKERLEKIENRFPEESTLEKLASVNDAILGTKIEELQKSVERIESKLLSKWDVAKIVFTIIGALGALIGLAIAIIKFITKT